MAFSERLKEYAMEIGFNLIGFTDFTPSKKSSLLKNWISMNCHGSMGYLEKSLNIWENPYNFFSQGKTVISLAVNYYNVDYDEIVSQKRDFFAKVSRYASSLDYHIILREMAEKLILFIKKEIRSDLQYRICVDACPIPEKEFAFNAGIGWTGKNTCIISPSFGSWIFLSEVIIDIEIEKEEPLQGNCGNCKKCIEACPTGAINEKGYLDARKCISYLTVEHKGSIPISLRHSLGSMIFGCDICQEVCPKNKKINDTRVFKELKFPVINLQGIFLLNKKSINENFSRTSLIRAGRRGLLRNAAIVMGNSRNPVFLDQLSIGISDRDPIIRSHCAWAVGKIGGYKAKNILDMALKKETDPYVKHEIQAALENL